MAGATAAGAATAAGPTVTSQHARRPRRPTCGPGVAVLNSGGPARLSKAEKRDAKRAAKAEADAAAQAQLAELDGNVTVAVEPEQPEQSEQPEQPEQPVPEQPEEAEQSSPKVSKRAAKRQR